MRQLKPGKEPLTFVCSSVAKTRVKCELGNICFSFGAFSLLPVPEQTGSNISLEMESTNH